MWKEKAKLKKHVFESHVRNYKARIYHKNIAASPYSKNRLRPAPRMPQFMIESLEHDSTPRQLSNIPSLTQGDRMKDFSIQTDLPAEQKEIFNRIDSGIDVHHSEDEEKAERDDGAYMLDKIIAGLFETPKSVINPQKAPLSAVDPVKVDLQIDPQALSAMEKRLSEFQESKTRHLHNIERLKIVKNDVDSILMNPKCPSSVLKEKIREMESLGREITHYKENVDSRKQDIEVLSQKLLLLIQKTRL